MNSYTLLIVLVFMVAYFYWSTRQQRKRMKEQEENRKKALVKGAEIVTIGGLYGVIDEVDFEKDIMVLDVEGVYLTFELRAFARLVTPAVTNDVTTDDVVPVDGEVAQVNASATTEDAAKAEEVVVASKDHQD
ncbi:preprotein translocase subunit YajC [Streptococcus sp. DD12]|uniref:preprotein translocase subunit YajC n=1 Tax=Streptococcus sp. DD12 TaxID=1777880 RepID=UPI00079523C5|nr:preprotein translocase subunit YajC [Streptococcus sp. DD12]KXT76897.1 Preprotein translocase subunit YajC [Streptococcus sp. DD12]